MRGDKWTIEEEKAIAALVKRFPGETAVNIAKIAHEFGILANRGNRAIECHISKMKAPKVKTAPVREPSLLQATTADLFEEATYKKKYEALLDAVLYKSEPWPYRNGGMGLKFNFKAVTETLKTLEPKEYNRIINTFIINEREA